MVSYGLFEKFLDTISREGTAFKVLTVHVLYNLLGDLLAHMLTVRPALRLISYIGLITDENKLGIGSGLLYFGVPLLSGVFKSRSLCHVKNN